MLSALSVNRLFYPSDFQLLDKHDAYCAMSDGLVVGVDQESVSVGVEAYQAHFPVPGYCSKPIGEPVKVGRFLIQRMERYSSCE